uniref:Uncharacterized protein n=1 Tax=Anguilla anguilla TaxID=7936 RepID=A0A0E9REK3_ANGAN
MKYEHMTNSFERKRFGHLMNLWINFRGPRTCDFAIWEKNKLHICTIRFHEEMLAVVRSGHQKQTAFRSVQPLSSISSRTAQLNSFPKITSARHYSRKRASQEI